jgi:hypothetical protein
MRIITDRQGGRVNDRATDWGRLQGVADEAQQRASATDDPGVYHGAIAGRELHWHDGTAWLRRDSTGAWKTLAAGGDSDAARPVDWRTLEQRLR